MSVITQPGWTPPAGLTTDHPIVGWQNLFFLPSQVVTSFTAPGFPAGNMANPATYLKWKSNSGINQVVHIAINPQPISYVAIAGHNLGTAHIPVGLGKDAGNVQIFAPALVSGDGVILWRFNQITTTDIWINLAPGSPAASIFPEIAVVYVGSLLTVQRRIYAGHTPINQGRWWKATDGMSETGQFLGRILLQEHRKTKIPFSLLEPAWYRANFDPFLAQARDQPFFFAWRPNTYPDEVGYMWLTAQPAPVPTAPSNLISVNLEVSGIV